MPSTTFGLMEAKMWFVYLIQHSETKEIYSGLTMDMERRLKEHNDRRSRSTIRSDGQWHVVYYESYRSKKDAVSRELRLKQHGRAKQELLKRITNCLSQI